MREIKFRAWDKGLKKWIPIREMQINGDGGIAGIRYGVNNWKPIDRLELVEYTGLHDKNGKEIYEADILRYIRFGWRCAGHPKDNTDLVTYYKVIWDEAECAFKADNKAMTGSLCFDDSRAKRSEIEVISNIYENPDLLEAK